MVALTELLGSVVRTGGEVALGRLVEVVVEPRRPRPAVTWLGLGRGRRVTGWVPWRAVKGFAPGAVDVDATPRATGPPEDELRLVRDVLDMQIVDLAGKRVARVAEVHLVVDGGGASVVGVEVGAAGVWRRLGLRRLANRERRHVVDWPDIHLTTGPASAHAGDLTRLSSEQVATAASSLPGRRAVRMLLAIDPDVAARALGAAHPDIGAQVVGSVPEHHAASLLRRMPVERAASVLRRLPPHRRRHVLRRIEPPLASDLERAAEAPGTGTAPRRSRYARIRRPRRRRRRTDAP